MGQDVLKEMATISKLLQLTMRDTRAFTLAVERGYIVVTEDGQHLRWMLGSITLLAYFCGKLWCGDYSAYNRRLGTKVWRQGEKSLPVSELHRVFGINYIRQSRQNRKNHASPENFQLVDNLFDI